MHVSCKAQQGCRCLQHLRNEAYLRQKLATSDVFDSLVLTTSTCELAVVAVKGVAFLQGVHASKVT